MLKFKNYKFKEKFYCNDDLLLARYKMVRLTSFQFVKPRLVGRYVLQFHQFVRLSQI